MTVHASRLCTVSNVFQITLRSYTLKMIEENNWYRASGELICFECGRKYEEHPCHKDFATFHILCNGTMIKS